MEVAGSRLTETGELIIESSRYRSQEQNRKDATRRLVELIRGAKQKPKQRRKTRPTAESKRKRLQQKRRQSEKKRLRHKPRGAEY